MILKPQNPGILLMQEGFLLPWDPRNAEFVDGGSWKGNLVVPQALGWCKSLCWAEGQLWEARKENLAHPQGFEHSQGW